MAEGLDDIVAEFAALNVLAMSTLKAVAKQQPDPTGYLKKLLEDGLVAIETTNYWSVPQERKAAFLENAKARFTDMIVGIRLT